MKSKSRVSWLLLAGWLMTGPVLVQAAENDTPAASAKTGKLIPVSEKEAAWAAEARKRYPLSVCVVSDEELGSMGESPEYIYRVEGQPDRLVVVCCDGCSEDFLGEPARFLAKIDAAKKNGAKVEKKTDAGKHEGHH